MSEEMNNVDEEAEFTCLFERYSSSICTYVRYMVENDDEMKDIAQETFLKAFMWFSTIRAYEETRLRAWLYHVAYTTTVDFQRRKKAHLKFINDTKVQNGRDSMSTPSVEESVEKLERITFALSKLSTKQRACILLSQQGFKQHEIGQILGITEKCVSSYMSRARDKFRRVYRGDTDFPNIDKGKGGRLDDTP